MATSPSNPPVELIPLTDIDLGPNLLRSDITADAAAMADLKASIQRHGILQPVGVRRLGVRYELVFGFRRQECARQLGRTHLPATILELSTLKFDRLALQIQENEQRLDVEPVRFGQLLQTMLHESGCTQKELSQKLHLSEAKVSRLLSLAALPAELQVYVAEGHLGVSTAIELSQFQGEEYQELLQKAVTGTASRDDLIGRRKAKSRTSPSKPAVRGRVAIPVDASCTLSLTGIDPSLETVIEVLQTTLTQAKKARSSGFSLATFTRSQTDRHRTSDGENPS